MDNFIERYVYDVVRRLPEKERAEVSRELRSNIYDMLPDNAGVESVKAVLYEMGPPSELADRYRQAPNYLISPAVYSQYVRVLKWLLPLAGAALMVIGMITNTAGLMSSGSEGIDAASFIGATLGKSLSMGISGAFQALLWATAAFIIVDRAGAKLPASGWRVEDLPERIFDSKSEIPLADSIAELILTAVFALVAILFCTGVFPAAFMFIDGAAEIMNLFQAEFLRACVIFIALAAFVNVCECAVKIAVRRWTPLVCGAVIVSNIVNVGALIYLSLSPDIFSPEFLAMTEAQEWGKMLWVRFMDNRMLNPVVIVVCFVVIAAAAECIHAVYKTLQNGTRAVS